MPRIASFVVAFTLTVTAVPAFAHHGEAGSLGTVRVTTPVMAGGTLLQPGVYEVRDTGQHPMPMPGQGADAQVRIEFVRNGMVVATDVAEVMTGDGAATVGTSGGNRRLRFEQLKGGDFARVSTTRNGERYLIHLPTSKAGG